MDITVLINKSVLKELLKTCNKQDIFKMISKEIDMLNIVEEKPIDKTTDKYIMLLKLVNKILISISKEEIDDLRQFKNINRKQLITDDVKNIINEHASNIFKVFDKKTCNWYGRNHIQYYTLTLLRHLTTIIGLKLTRKKRNRHEHSLSVTDILYSIE